MRPINGARIPAVSGTPVAVFTPSLRERATAFHRETYGAECDCLNTRGYPCEICAEEITDLVTLLDGVARDAIEVVCKAWERVR